MSIPVDQIRQKDAYLDRVNLLATADLPSTHSHALAASPRVATLQSAVKALSAGSASATLLPPWRIASALSDLRQASTTTHGDADPAVAAYTAELAWMVVAKAATQTHGLLLSMLLEQAVPLSEDLWYWDEVLGSYPWSGVLVAQQAPLRAWELGRDVIDDARRQFEYLRAGTDRDDAQAASIGRGVGETLTEQWKTFYRLVKGSVRDRSVADIQRRLISPVARARAEVRSKQARLRRFKELSASGLGLLVNEAMDFVRSDDSSALEHEQLDGDDYWKTVVERGVSLLSGVASKVTAVEMGVPEFEEAAIACIADDQDFISQAEDMGTEGRPAFLADKLLDILQVHIPYHVAASQNIASRYGRPSRMVRYWIPATVLLLSSTTLLRILVNRQAQLITWFHDLGATVRDFWLNWVVEPTRKIIGTIRHDKGSEVAIMSRESLRGDRESLERMVVDFVVDNQGRDKLHSNDLDQIRAKVKEGDLTPVLRAYERDLRKPFKGAVRGDLIRTLLIQVQKTKVDVEVALSGIDALLKSQELVFGFIGLTPGVFVCLATIRYLGGLFGRRGGGKHHRKAGQTMRTLRNIDRILSTAAPTDNNLLSYTDHGILLCEVHVLRKCAHGLLPGRVERDFLEDVNDLCDLGRGIDGQVKALGRITWAYAKWL